MVTMKEAIRREISKLTARIIRVETCEVLDVQLHKQPDDKKQNTVTIRLRDSTNLTECTEIIRYRVPVFCSYVGHLFGLTWSPAVGDMVQVLFLSNEKAYVISPYYNQEQKPLCRQHVDDKVMKFCKTPAATYESTKCPKIKYLKKFDNPDHPVCFKFFGKDRSVIFISDCPLGHSHPDCELCTDLEDLNNNTNSVKFYPYDHPEHPNRIRISQKKGQTVQLEDDGSILMEDSKGNFICLQGNESEGGIVIKDRAGSFISLNGNGTVTVHTVQNGSHNLFNEESAPYGFDDLDKTPKQEAD